MRKKLDETWAEEMRRSTPPVGYRMTLEEGWALMNMGDPLYLAAAAYNYGFKRGQNYERKKPASGEARGGASCGYGSRCDKGTVL